MVVSGDRDSLQTPDAAAEVLKVMRTNTTIQDLILANTGLKWYALLHYGCRDLVAF